MRLTHGPKIIEGEGIILKEGLQGGFDVAVVRIQIGEFRWFQQIKVDTVGVNRNHCEVLKAEEGLPVGTLFLFDEVHVGGQPAKGSRFVDD